MSNSTDSAVSKNWSIARRVTLWVAFCVVVGLVLEIAIADWIVRSTVRRELDALVVEESAELRADFLEHHVSPEMVEQLAEEFNEEHSDATVSLRVWRAPFVEPWVTAGAPPRVSWDNLPAFGDAAVGAPDRLTRFHMDTVRGKVEGPLGVWTEVEMRTVLLVDGTPREKALRRGETLSMLISFAVGAGVLIVGIAFARRLARLLKEVAEGASFAETNLQAAYVGPERLPVEVLGVVDAFRENLKELNARHSRNVLMTAGLAHELRSPLQNLITGVEVGLLSERDGPEYRRLLVEQLDELRNLALVVDNLVTLSSIRDQENLKRSETFDFAAEARIRLGHEEQEGARRNVTVEVQESGDCRFRGDREALVLVLRNLVGNAVTWTADSTTVDVTIDGREGCLKLVVEDHGPGVAEHETEEIFEAFFQGSAPEGNRAGYGLGLALVRTAVQAEGGTINVEKIEMGGARFVVELPRESPFDG